MAIIAYTQSYLNIMLTLENAHDDGFSLAS